MSQLSTLFEKNQQHVLSFRFSNNSSDYVGGGSIRDFKAELTIQKFDSIKNPTLKVQKKIGLSTDRFRTPRRANQNGAKSQRQSVNSIVTMVNS